MVHRLYVRLSDRPSVTLVDCDHTGWNSSKIISRLVSLGYSLSAGLRKHGSTPRGTPEIFTKSDPPPVDLSVADIRRQIAAEWYSAMVTMESQQETTIALSNGMIDDPLRPPLSPKVVTTSSLPKNR